MYYTHVKCLNDVTDDLGTYCNKGETYEIIELIIMENKAIIQTNVVDDCDEMYIALDDEDFEFVVFSDNMSKYKIVDNGVETYEIEAENALQALTNWMLKYHNPEAIEYIAENSEEYIARLQITKVE